MSDSDSEFDPGAAVDGDDDDVLERDSNASASESGSRDSELPEDATTSERLRALSRDELLEMIETLISNSGDTAEAAESYLDWRAQQVAARARAAAAASNDGEGGDDGVTVDAIVRASTRDAALRRRVVHPARLGA